MDGCSTVVLIVDGFNFGWEFVQKWIQVVFKNMLYKIGTMAQIAWQGVHKFKVWVGANPIWTSVQIQYFSRVVGGEGGR